MNMVLLLENKIHQITKQIQLYKGFIKIMEGR